MQAPGYNLGGRHITKVDDLGQDDVTQLSWLLGWFGLQSCLVLFFFLNFHLFAAIKD